MPDGRVFHTGRATVKSVVGYDLTRLIVGSEGTLAIITQLTLRLLPKPETKATVSAFFHDLDQAAQAVQAVLLSGMVPTALEFIDRTSLWAVDQHIGLGLPSGVEAMVLVDVDGAPEVVRGQAGRLAELLEKTGGHEVQTALDPAQAAVLWQARRAMGPAVFNLAPSKYNEDVAVPLGRLAEVIAAIQEIGHRRGLPIPTFGHAGDGNLHVNVMFDAKQPDQLEAANQAVTDIFAKVLQVGGTLSGEHGVGTSKLGFVGAEIDPVALELMYGVKRLFDPAGILNPHKAIPSRTCWREPEIPPAGVLQGGSPPHLRKIIVIARSRLLAATRQSRPARDALVLVRLSAKHLTAIAVMAQRGGLGVGNEKGGSPAAPWRSSASSSPARTPLSEE